MDKTEKKPQNMPLSPDTIETGMLEPIEYAYGSRRDIEIVIDQPEYTAVCPRTGLPDFGCITISYVPSGHIIELKSLKYYLLQYRSVGIFYENAVNRILDDLAAVLAPRQMTVTGQFTSRGGISTTVTVRHPD